MDIRGRGGGRAIDGRVVDLPDASLQGLLASEISQVDGVDVEEIRPVADALHDPRLDALETAAILVGASDRDELVESVVVHASRAVGAALTAVVLLEAATILAEEGSPPCPIWLTAFVAGPHSSARVCPGESGLSDVVLLPQQFGRAPCRCRVSHTSS